MNKDIYLTSAWKIENCNVGIFRFFPHFDAANMKYNEKRKKNKKLRHDEYALRSRVERFFDQIPKNSFFEKC